MRSGPRVLFVPLSALLLAETAHAAAILVSLGDFPGGLSYSNASGISGDGSVVIGMSGSDESDNEGFRWTAAEGMVSLGSAPGRDFLINPQGVSFDGAVVVGQMANGSTYNEAFRWTRDGGLVGLGYLPTQSAADSFSGAGGVSADGSVVTGASSTGSCCTSEAFLWTPNSGMVGLGDLPGGEFASGAGGVSRDGAFVVGQGWSESGQEAFRWDANEGLVGLGDLPGGDFFSQPGQISADGSVVVGDSISADSLGQLTAFRWTEAEGMVSLGTLPGGGFTSEALDVSADGSVIVGVALGVSGFEAFIWDQVHGMQSLQQLLISEYGLDLQGRQLGAATAISDDGRTITGSGINPSGQNEAWLVSVPEPRTTALLATGLLSFGLRRRLS